MKRIHLPTILPSDLSSRVTAVTSKLQVADVPSAGEVVGWVRDGGYAAAGAIAIAADWIAGVQERAVEAVRSRLAR